MDAVEIAKTGHVVLPAYGRRLLLWIDDITGVELLAQIREPGCVVLTPWEAFGPRITKNLNKPISSAATVDDVERLAAHRAQFLKLTVYERGRLKLPNLILAEISEFAVLPIYCPVAFYSDHIELRSLKYHHEQMSKYSIDAEIIASDSIQR